MLTAEMILSRAENPEVRVGVGSRKGSAKVERSVEMANKRGYGTSTVYQDPEGMIMDLLEGRINAAVRGDLGSNEVMSVIRRDFGVDRVMRAAAMEPREGALFFLAPVGIDEGWSLEDKEEIVHLGNQMLESMGVEPHFAIMSGGRTSDIGRNEYVDRTIREAEELVRWGCERGMEIEHTEILVEKAASVANFVLAPDGVSGNIIFRTLHFLGSARALGAPVINLDRIFVDTSRAKESYLDSIGLASFMAHRMQQNI
ncbi:MAG: methanogenesis marker protein Mmp4/MtxX [Methanomassiliicoccales archaeon]